MELPKDPTLKLKDLCYKISILRDRVEQIIGGEEATVEGLKEAEQGFKMAMVLVSSSQPRDVPINPKIRNNVHRHPDLAYTNYNYFFLIK